MNTALSGFNETGSSRVLNTLQIGLGLIWMIDEMMQMEPGVFHPAYYGHLPSTVMPSVLQYIQQRAPGWISWAVSATQWSYQRWPIETNVLIILIQFSLAACLLIRLPDKYAKFGMWGSVVWGLIIWVFVQSLGGARSWGYGFTFYAGFPGSALLYAAAGGVMLLSRYGWSVESLFKLTTRVLAVFFWVFGIIQLLPFAGQWRTANQMFIFANSAFQQYQPDVLKVPVAAYSLWVSSHPITNNVLLAVGLFCAGAAVWIWRRSRIARGYVYIWLFLVWWLGMDFGNMFSGLCTDLNTPPILFVMLLAFRPLKRRFEALEATTHTVLSHTVS